MNLAEILTEIFLPRLSRRDVRDTHSLFSQSACLHEVLFFYIESDFSYLTTKVILSVGAAFSD